LRAMEGLGWSTGRQALARAGSSSSGGSGRTVGWSQDSESRATGSCAAGTGQDGDSLRAVHVGLDRPVALKVLGTTRPDSSARQRF
jgi:hypothetical protein